MGYYEKGVRLCGKCSYKCNSCIDNADKCLSCPSTTRVNDGTCKCQVGFYEVLN